MDDALQTPPLIEEPLTVESCLGKEASFESVLIGQFPWSLDGRAPIHIGSILTGLSELLEKGEEKEGEEEE